MNINSSKINFILGIQSLFCVALLLLRIYVTGSFFYTFLIWNLFLAAVPYFISSWLNNTVWIKKQALILLCILGFWLLFLPNAPYLITDLMHLRHAKSSLSWLDPFLLFAFALNGLLLGLLSMYQMYKIVVDRWNRKTAKGIMFVFVFLCGFGIYLGRFQRWNSWELFSDPIILLKDCIRCISDPVHRVRTWGITLGFGTFLWILFITMTSFFPIKKDAVE